MSRIIPIVLVLSFLFTSLSCKRVLHKASTNYTPYQVEGNSPQADKEIEALIRPYKTGLDLVMNEVIGECMQDMPKKKPESLLGNWMADAIHEHTEETLGKEIAFAVQNYGGIRIPKVSKGPITKGKIFELMPFDNSIIVLNLDGQKLEEFILHMAKSNGWPVSHTLRANYVSGKLDAEIRGKKLDYKQNYLVAVPDYIANGGSDCAFLIDTDREIIDSLIRDVLVDYVIAKQNLDAKIEGRFVVKK